MLAMTTMAYIPLSPEHLRLRDPLPFGVYDANGMLLLPARGVIQDQSKLALLQAKHLFVDEDESYRWRSSFKSTVGSLIRTNASLQHIAVANLRRDREDPARQRQDSLTDTWHMLMQSLAGALRTAGTQSGWLETVQASLAQARALEQRSAHAPLYLLVQHALHSCEQYSSQHAMLCALICERVGTVLGWPAEEIDSLVGAALTMNVAMTVLQDNLAKQRLPLSPDQRERIVGHGLRGSTLLAGAGVTDARWLKIVRLHHDTSLLERPLKTLDAASRLARLLYTVDRFTAKISRRSSRLPMSPLAAARSACVGADGQPDELGAAILKALGMYPPGSYVQLANGEVGVVMTRGQRANEPLVAVLVGTSGLALSAPVLRDTSSAARAVVGVAAVDSIKVRLQHEQLLALL
jgi:HD-GYP domain-containing protein (c-di-GMP phosphodiesterase class II)